MATIGKSTLALLMLVAQTATAEHQIVGRVVGVADGDTLTLLDASRETHKIRLAEIDAPESKQDFGQVSKQSLSNLAFGKQATAACSTKDRYRRSVCKVTVNGILVNAEQVTRGLAWVYDKYTPRHSPLYDFQTAAQAQRRGLWRLANPTPPWEWRRAQRE